ncbi:MAG: ADP-ribosylation factor-like protein [Candidatus Heimdallarchaeota archaeon]
MGSHFSAERKEIDLPLIVVIGLSGAGKTSFIKRVQGTPFDRSSRLSGSDSEVWWVGNIVCITLDLSNDEAFRASVWEDYVPFANGLIFVIDGADPDNLEEAYQWLAKANQWIQSAIPILLLWNKSDLPQFIPFTETYRNIDSFFGGMSCFLQIQIWEGSILHSQDYNVILDWFTVIADHHSLALPARFQALRVYFKAPEFVVAEVGRIDIFDTIFELIKQTLLPPIDNLRFIPLCGGNYIIWQSSDLCHCLAIFPEETIPELGQITVDTTLVFVEKKLQSLRRTFAQSLPEIHRA